MFTDKKNILQLLAVIKGLGIRRVVLCPGSRNIPLVRSFLSEPYFECYSITDERSAGFFAIGLSLEGASVPQPVVVCCTSGTAVANLHPAVAEAYYQGIPLIVISADRPQQWIGQMDGQTLPQPGLFGALVKMSVNLPVVRDLQDEWYCNRLVNEALLELDHHGIGPVQINVPIDEPLFDFNTERLPDERIISRYYDYDHYSIGSLEDAYTADNKGTYSVGFGMKKPVELLLQRLGEFSKKMIICGQMPPAAAIDESFDTLLDSYVCLGEHLGNNRLSDRELYNFDVALYTMSDEDKREFSPDLLITFGGHVVSKRLKDYLRKFKPREHWHVSADGNVTDLFCSLTAVVEMEPLHFLRRLAEHETEYLQLQNRNCPAQSDNCNEQSSISAVKSSSCNTQDSISTAQSNSCNTHDSISAAQINNCRAQGGISHTQSNSCLAQNDEQYFKQSYVQRWRDFCSSLPRPCFGYSQTGVVGKLINAIPNGAVLHLSNSSSVRYAQLFKIDDSIKVFCNRGTNGIEGSLSSAIGYAAVSGSLNFVVIGDLSFFYDMNALWNPNISGNLRIMMINNGGGEIFHSLPGLKMDERARSFITATHTTSARGWAEERGFRYFGVHNAEEFDVALAQFTGPSTCGSPMFMEVFTLPDNDVKLLKEFYHSVKTAKRAIHE